ncbi:hypothetical protein AXG93_2015s1040 [Marchantia polymorpha subsp. ruderalis]|uniref:Uncharacterized protein n=1 Tax=Marchantia polymorpha subsp. ruderalis TaxID=1480154 RepID=A0A176W2U4_MARPO|nr:hypothetical protein AXG93_2015s1040 [Marchantia polymorpha subsp. ruderalis]
MAGKRNGCKAERGQQMLQRGIQSMELIANKARESSAMVHPAEVNSQRITAGTASDPLHSCKGLPQGPEEEAHRTPNGTENGTMGLAVPKIERSHAEGRRPEEKGLELVELIATLRSRIGADRARGGGRGRGRIRGMRGNAELVGLASDGLR